MKVNDLLKKWDKSNNRVLINFMFYNSEGKFDNYLEMEINNFNKVFELQIGDYEVLKFGFIEYRNAFYINVKWE